MPTATLTDGGGAGGGSSHPDVTEQKDFLFQALAKRSHLSGRGELHSAVPWFRGGEKQLCLQQKPQGHCMEAEHDCPAGRALWLPWPAPSLAGSRAGCSCRGLGCEKLLLCPASPAAAPAVTPAPRAACHSCWMPHA